MCTLHGLPVAVALTGAKADERVVLLDFVDGRVGAGGSPAGQVLLADKNYAERPL